MSSARATTRTLELDLESSSLTIKPTRLNPGEQLPYLKTGMLVKDFSKKPLRDTKILFGGRGLNISCPLSGLRGSRPKGRGIKRKRRVREAREVQTREDRGTFSFQSSFWLSSLPFYGLPCRLSSERY